VKGYRRERHYLTVRLMRPGFWTRDHNHAASASAATESPLAHEPGQGGSQGQAADPQLAAQTALTF
jgi:hypothetical protein